MSMPERPGRTAAQLDAWSEFLELCEDECEVFRTSHAMRTAVIEVEKELARLHKVEALCIRLARELDEFSDVRNQAEALIPGCLESA